jgi:hypothetical protein
MSDAEQFTAAVSERSGPTDWRGGLERSGARWGRGGRFSGGWRYAAGQHYRARALSAREK